MNSYVESPYNQSHDYNKLKAPVITANNYYLNSPFKTESVNISFVKHIEDRIANLKNKISSRNNYRINFQKIKALNSKFFMIIMQFMNYEFFGFYFSCRILQSEILSMFKEGSKLIALNFQKTYLQYLTINIKKLALSVTKKKGGQKRKYFA